MSKEPTPDAAGDAGPDAAPVIDGLHRLKLLVELCGRHPFATGLFAILGILGLLFSFFTFGVDQIQNRQDDAKADQLATSIARVEGKVEQVAPVEEPQDFDPITSRVADVMENADNLSFDPQFSGRSMAWIAKNDPSSFSNVPFVTLSIKSSAQEEFVQISPYLVVDVQSVAAPASELATLYEGERGGAQAVREFRADIIPKVGRQYAPLINGSDGSYRNDIDYFSLMPREPEEFFLNMNFQPGYVYRIRVGVPYRYRDNYRIHWATPVFKAGIPSSSVSLSENGAPFQQAQHPDFLSTLREETAEHAASNHAAAHASRVLKPFKFEGLS